MKNVINFMKAWFSRAFNGVKEVYTSKDYWKNIAIGLVIWIPAWFVISLILTIIAWGEARANEGTN